MDESQTLAEIGEKKFIELYLRPLFNPEKDINGVGDDCAALEVPHGSLALLSTDRVPADLISFRTGVLDYDGLGRYLAVLNFSDIAACGGTPSALLLNFGVPSSLPISSLMAICRGVMSVISPLGARVVGGDMTLSSELSISATAFGSVERGKMLRRSGASSGDSVFISRVPGLTPAALHYCINPHAFVHFAPEEIVRLKMQFLEATPMIEFGRLLAGSGVCSAAIDNTDGLWQSLSELSRESKTAIVLENQLLHPADIVRKCADKIGQDPVVLAFSAGADFSLVGTLRGSWTTEAASAFFRREVTVVGHCSEGAGVFMKSRKGIVPFEVPGWDYFKKAQDGHIASVIGTPSDSSINAIVATGSMNLDDGFQVEAKSGNNH